MSADPLVRTARMWGLLSVAVIAIGCAAAAWLLGAPGFYGVLLGLALPTVFFGLTLAVALGTRARSGGVLGAVILGSWLVKLVLLIVALAVLKPLDFEYMTINPHSDSAGLQESVINYTGNKNPELITCLHEEVAVAMAHGYFKIAGKPMASLIYSSVGLQHASMAVYSAFCDRVPVYMLLGNGLESIGSRSVQDAASMVRDFTKWDDTPVSLQHFAQSFVRAYKIAMTPPYGPVAISLDAGLIAVPHSGQIFVAAGRTA